MVNFIHPLVEILGFVVFVSVGSWKIFLLGFLSLNDDCFHTFCMNNIPVAQLQIASLVEELVSLREGFVTFDCGYFLSKIDNVVLLNAACRVMKTSHFY